MAAWLIRTALRSSLGQVRYVTPVHPRRATGLTSAVYRQVERDFGMLAPPIALHSPAPATLAAAWAMLRESLVVTSPVSREVREAVATGVSRANRCPYCVEVHTAVLDALGPGDPGTDAVAAWARGTGEPTFPAGHTAQLIAVAVTFHYLNRMVNVFLGDSPLPAGLPATARARARRFVGRFMRRPALRGGRPMDSVELLAPAPAADDLGWAAGQEHLAAAFGRAAAAVDAVPRNVVPPAVRELVNAELAGWDGAMPGLSRAWTDRAVRSVSGPDRPAARLALLVAKASYQVGGDVVAAYRRDRPSDAALVGLVSWAAFAAARQAGSRLARRAPGQTGLGSVA